MQFSATTLFFNAPLRYWVLIFGSEELDLFGSVYWKWKSVLVVGRARGGFPRVSRALENLCLWTEKSVIRDMNGVAESEIAWIIFHTKRLLHFTSALRYLALGCAMSNCQLMTKDRRVCLQTGQIGASWGEWTTINDVLYTMKTYVASNALRSFFMIIIIQHIHVPLLGTGVLSQSLGLYHAGPVQVGNFIHSIF